MARREQCPLDVGSKRLQENLRQLNNAIDHLSLPSSNGDATTTTDLPNGGGGNAKTTTTTAAACRFPIFDNSVPSARSVLTDGEPARPKETWMDPYSANFDLFSNRSSATKNVIGQLSANNSEPIESVVMKRSLSVAGPVAFGESNNAAASVFNRPLNANAAPFVPSFGGQQSGIAVAADLVLIEAGYESLKQPHPPGSVRSVIGDGLDRGSKLSQSSAERRRKLEDAIAWGRVRKERARAAEERKRAAERSTSVRKKVTFLVIVIVTFVVGMLFGMILQYYVNI